MDNQDITKLVEQALEDGKGDNIAILDTSTISPLFDTMVICSGTSTRHIHALSVRVEEAFKKNHLKIAGIEGKNNSGWVLFDGGNIVVHIMLPDVREYYALDTLWNEALRNKTQNPA